MFPKILEGFSLVIGMCILMHVLFADDRYRTPARNVSKAKTARQAAPGMRRAAYMAFGSSLLIYGMAEMVLRGR